MLQTSYPVGRTQLIILRVNAINLTKQNPEKVNTSPPALQLFPTDRTPSSCVFGGDVATNDKVNYSHDKFLPYTL